MKRLHFTERDLEFLRAVYFLDGIGEPVGPAKLARVLEVARVTAMKAMRRLEALGFGTYVVGEGLVLSGEGVAEVEESIWRHHVMERLMTESLGIPCSEACDESSRIQFGLSDGFVRMAFERMGKPENCDCGCAISPPYTDDRLDGCNWCRRQLVNGRRERGGVKG